MWPIVLLVLLLGASSAHAADAPPRRRALVVGTSRYASWDRLPNAVEDANALAALLESRFGFEAEPVLADPTMAEFKARLASLAREAGPTDDLLVFVAGHGHFDAVDRAGYLVFADSARDCGSNCYAFDNVKRALYGTHARHVLLLVDACYAGAFDIGLAMGAEVPRGELPAQGTAQDMLRDYDRFPSRLMLASVGATTTSDGAPGSHSRFVTALLEALAGTAELVSLDRIYLGLRETRGLSLPRPVAFASEVPHHPSGTFLFQRSVSLCESVRAFEAAGANGFSGVADTKSPSAAIEPWATARAATWSLPSARCSVWHWESDGHDEVRCDFGPHDPGLVDARAGALLESVAQCAGADAKTILARARRRDDTEYRDWVLTLGERRVTASAVCDTTCALSLVFE